MNLIQPSDLVDIQAQADQASVTLGHIMVYAQRGDHPLNHVFREPIYRRDARMWMHKDLAEIVLLAADRCFRESGYQFVLLDCLRTTDAQARMAQTSTVKANPHWTAPGPGQLLSNPGEGAHPRAMAIDIMLVDADGHALDMGTVFDHFSTDPSDNPAARDYPVSPDVAANRALLNAYMVNAAKDMNRDLWLLPSEWWDFRFPPHVYNAYAPLSDSDLPEHMRMCG